MVRSHGTSAEDGCVMERRGGVGEEEEETENEGVKLFFLQEACTEH